MAGFRYLCLLWVGMLCVAGACNRAAKGGKEPARVAQHQLDSLEARLMSRPGKSDDMPQVLELARKYQEFRADFATDTAAPKYMLKEGQIFYNYLRDYEQSASILANLSTTYPKAPQRPMALFLLANAYQDGQDTARAQLTLRQLLADYPGSQMAVMGEQLSAFIRRGGVLPADSLVP